MIRLTNMIRTCSGLVVCVALVACGGGGGSESPNPKAKTQLELEASAALRSDIDKSVEAPVLKSELVNQLSVDQFAQVSDPTQRMKQSMPIGTARHWLTLGPLGEAERFSREEQLSSSGIPKKIAEGRSLSKEQLQKATSAAVSWVEQADGRQIAVWEFASPEAEGLRLGVYVARLLPDAVFRFSGSAEAIEHVFSGQQVLRNLQKNIDSGDVSSAAKTFWSPFVSGQTVTFVVELPAGSDKNSVDIRPTLISHFTESPKAWSQSFAKGIGASAACNLDVNCYQESSISNSTAKMVYTKETGASYLCSGTLLNDKGNTYTPYFLSANHCISRQTLASTVQTFWFYRSASCGSGALSPSSVSRSGGATLLYANASTDTSFLRLNDYPPSGAIYAGWTPTSLAMDAPLTGVHHPSGDLQKISFGQLRAYENCFAGTGGGFDCTASTAGASNFFEVNFTRGTTEGGSSGSGLFSSSGAGQKVLVGQLYGGDSSCSNPSGTNTYGRFDVAYRAAISQWLDSGQTTGGSVSAPKSGGWWNPSESGRGYSFAVSGNTLVFYTYIFELDGRATWYGGALAKQSDGSYSGQLQEYFGGQSLTGTYKSPSVTRNATNANVTCSTVKSCTLTWAGGVVPIQWFDFGTSSPTVANTPSPGLWWDPSGSGRGYVVEVQGNIMAVYAYLFDGSGNPMWYLTAGPVNADGSYDGQFQEYQGGQTLVGTYKAPTVKGNVSNVRWSCTTATTCTMIWAGGTVAVQRFLF